MNRFFSPRTSPKHNILSRPFHIIYTYTFQSSVSEMTYTIISKYIFQIVYVLCVIRKHIVVQLLNSMSHGSLNSTESRQIHFVCKFTISCVCVRARVSIIFFKFFNERIYIYMGNLDPNIFIFIVFE